MSHIWDDLDAIPADKIPDTLVQLWPRLKAELAKSTDCNTNVAAGLSMFVNLMMRMSPKRYPSKKIKKKVILPLVMRLLEQAVKFKKHQFAGICADFFAHFCKIDPPTVVAFNLTTGGRLKLIAAAMKVSGLEFQHPSCELNTLLQAAHSANGGTDEKNGRVNAEQTFEFIDAAGWSDEDGAIKRALRSNREFKELPMNGEGVPACGMPGCPVRYGKMKKCARCLKTYYCSVEHQRAHWAKHKPDCHSPDCELKKKTLGFIGK
jgi:hypothetical protein